MIVTKTVDVPWMCVRVVAHPQNVLKVLAIIGYKREGVFVAKIVRIITLVHLHLSLVDTHPVSLANTVTDLLDLVDAVNIVTDLPQDAVNQVIQIALDVVAVEIQITLDEVVVVDEALLRRNNNDTQTDEDDLTATMVVVFAARVLVQSVHTQIVLVSRRQRILNGVHTT